MLHLFFLFLFFPPYSNLGSGSLNNCYCWHALWVKKIKWVSVKVNSFSKKLSLIPQVLHEANSMKTILSAKNGHISHVLIFAVQSFSFFSECRNLSDIVRIILTIIRKCNSQYALLHCISQCWFKAFALQSCFEILLRQQTMNCRRRQTFSLGITTWVIIIMKSP